MKPRYNIFFYKKPKKTMNNIDEITNTWKRLVRMQAASLYSLSTTHQLFTLLCSLGSPLKWWTLLVSATEECTCFPIYTVPVCIIRQTPKLFISKPKCIREEEQQHTCPLLAPLSHQQPREQVWSVSGILLSSLADPLVQPHQLLVLPSLPLTVASGLCPLSTSSSATNIYIF